MHERLAELRELHELKQHEVAEVIGVAKSTYGNFETGIREMNYNLQVKIADYYNVSLDYLHGRTESPNMNKEKHSSFETEFMVKALKLYKETRTKEKRG